MPARGSAVLPAQIMIRVLLLGVHFFLPLSVFGLAIRES